ncbi:MAG: MFS transporter [Candidatus Izemoplasmataceae bacterium]
MKRIGLFVIGSTLMMLLMGTVYSYSVFRVFIENYYEINATLSGLPYMLALFFYAFSMMISGRILTHDNTLKIALIGSFMIGSGWLLSGLSKHFIGLVIGYGVISGSGVGLVYGIPLFIVQHANLKRAGFITGIILLGFGLSPLITAPIARLFLTSFGLHQTFNSFGVIFIILLSIFSFIYKPKTKSFEKKSIETVRIDKAFIYLYSLFLLATTIGLMMIGLSYPIGAINYGFEDHLVTLSVSFFALSNGLARPLFGYLMDRLGFHKTAYISYGLILTAALLAVFNQGQSLGLFMISFSLFWFNLGAWLAIAPIAIKQRYSLSSYARRYGLLFTAYGFGAILGVSISGLLLDSLGSTQYVYYMIIVVLLMGIFMIKKIPNQL